MAFVGLGVTGGIGAYKAVEIVRLLQKHGHRVQVVMTRAARRFIKPLTFEAITGQPVVTSQFTPGLNAGIEHIALASEMDLLLVAPATANILGTFAAGIAHDFLSALYLATKAPVLVAPAMNTNMWEHPAVRRNLKTLRDDGVRVVEPGEGYLACGWVGAGRLADPSTIADTAHLMLTSTVSLRGRRILVTAGPTIEDLDAVRFIGNRSSGRMGFALAAEAQRRGAEVTLVAGPTAVPPPPGLTETLHVRSARDMHAAVLSRVSNADVVIMAAAVADYTPAAGPLPQKLEKGGPLTVVLDRTTDILAELGRNRGEAERPVLVGFAAQVGPPQAAAERKLVAKHADLIVANDISAPGAGFDVSTNEVLLVTREDVTPLPLMSKVDVAARVLDRIELLLGASARTPATR
ncbi:MAG: bifunctional phosphopantothenoylcysteine decarboxylase/phosphopantothenate--cysteine ligase CoaBC [Vicinamibacterales bacterium]